MKDIFYTIKLIWKKHKFLFISLIILNILIGILPLFSVYCVQTIINGLVQKKSFKFILFVFLSYISISIGSSLLAAIQTYINGKISNYLSYEIEYDVLNVVSTLPLESFENEETYSQIDKLTNEAPTKPFEVFNSLNTISTALITLISGYIYIYKIKPWYALTLLTVSILSIPYLMYISKKQFNVHWNRAELERKNWYIKYLMTHDFSVKEIKFFNLGNYLKKIFSQLKKKFISQDLALLKQYSGFTFVYELLTAIVSSVLVLSIISAIFLGKALIGTLTSVTQIISLTQENTQTVISGIYSMKYNMLLLGKLFEFTNKNKSNNLIQYSKKKKLTSINTIEARNLNYNYGDFPALKGINFSLHKGMLVAIVGKNGSGKSTLVKLLSGLYKPQKGQLLINNNDILDYDESTFHNKIAVLFQNFVKYEMTLRENIGFGKLKDIKNEDKLTKVINKYAQSLPPNINLDSQLGNWFSNGQQLSGGQWQGVATCRTFLNNESQLVILDEPNSALDPIAEKKLFNEFKGFINNSRLGIFISHRIGAVKQADLILVLDKGQIIASGTHDELKENCSVYKELEEAEKYEDVQN